MNDALTTEEYQILSCSKEGWKDGEERYKMFMSILKKNIAFYQSCSPIDLSSVSFPDIIFDKKLLGNASIFINQSTFYGKTIFENLIYNEKVYIASCTFKDKCLFQNIIFNKDVVISNNRFEKEVIFKKLIFNDEAFFANSVFNDTLLIDTLSFSKEASFTDSLLKKNTVIKNIKGIEWFEWDDLYCMNHELCEWDELDNYIALKKTDEIKLVNFVQVIKQQFPEVIEEIKEELYQTSFGWSCFFWLEQFGHITKRLLGQKSYHEAEKYLNFMDEALKTDDSTMKNIIETAYVENILWQLSDKQQKEAWKYIPERTKRSYATIWSVPK